MVENENWQFETKLIFTECKNLVLKQFSLKNLSSKFTIIYKKIASNTLNLTWNFDVERLVIYSSNNHSFIYNLEKYFIILNILFYYLHLASFFQQSQPYQNCWCREIV